LHRSTTAAIASALRCGFDRPKTVGSRRCLSVSRRPTRNGFSGRASVNFHGSYIDIVGADDTQERFYDRNRQFDFSATQKITRNLHGYVNLLNLNDSLLSYFQSVPERVLQEEHDHWWAEFGVKIKF
jgi:hypothetical protein